MTRFFCWMFLVAVAAGALACGGADAPAERAASPGSAAAEQAATVTVLVPPSMQQQESALERTSTHYSISQAQTDLTLSLTGSLAVQGRSESMANVTMPTPSGVVRDNVPVYVSENEGIKTATWSEKGTAYALDVECASDRDARCQSNDYIIGVVRSLVEMSR